MNSYKSVKLACYTSNLTMSAAGNLSPLLFLTFHRLYHISFSQLGLLVLINFCTQLGIDLLFSFFSHKINLQKAVRLIPIPSIFGLILYAATPLLFPNHVFGGLVLSTLIIAASAGLCEVLVSPVIAAIPSRDPDREMSKLHSVYAWGVVGVIILGTIFLRLFSPEAWPYLALLFALLPLTSSLLFAASTLPEMHTPTRTMGIKKLFGDQKLWLCVGAIFFGGASECTMAQWCSGYLEGALGIPKLWGDLLGVSLFAVFLGLGRSLYAKNGKFLEGILLWGAVGATLCYLICALSPIPLLSLVSCALTGLFVSMMWPGSLVIAERLFPQGGVFLFALMAAGGDLGASVGPGLAGLITDAVIALQDSPLLSFWDLTPQELGLKAAMLAGAAFPFAAIFFFGKFYRNRGKK